MGLDFVTILVRPAKPANVGAAARALKNTACCLAHGEALMQFFDAEQVQAFAEEEYDGILSEETVDTPGRLEKSRAWILDPLDGTKEYGAGRELNHDDERVVGEIIAKEPEEGYGFRDLIATVVASEAFSAK